MYVLDQNKKIRYTPCKPQFFFYINVGYKRVNITRTYFPDEDFVSSGTLFPNKGLATEADRGHFTVKLLCFFTLLQNFHFCKIFTSTKFSLLQNFHFYVFSHFCKIFTSAKFSLLRFFTLLQNFHFCKIFTSTKFSLLQNFHFYVFSHFCKIFTSTFFHTSAKFSLLQNFHFYVLLYF